MTENSILETQSPMSSGKENKQLSGRSFNQTPSPSVWAQGSCTIIPLSPYLYSLFLVYLWKVFLRTGQVLSCNIITFIERFGVAAVVVGGWKRVVFTSTVYLPRLGLRKKESACTEREAQHSNANWYLPQNSISVSRRKGVLVHESCRVSTCWR